MASQFNADAYTEFVKALVNVASAGKSMSFNPIYNTMTREPPPDKYVNCTIIEKGDEDESG